MKPAGRFRAVLFDLDGTLYDERGGMRRGLAVAFDEARAVVDGIDLDRVAEIYPRVGRPIWDAGDLGPAGPERDTTSFQRRCRVWELLLREMGIRREGLAESLAGSYTRERARTHALFPDALGVLERLAGRYRIGLLSNGASDFQREKLRACRLEALLDPVLISAELGMAKPEPAFFREAARRWGCACGEVLMVGDSPRSDVAGARAAGMPAAWINRLEEEYPAGLTGPDYVIRRLSEVPAILGEDC